MTSARLFVLVLAVVVALPACDRADIGGAVKQMPPPAAPPDNQMMKPPPDDGDDPPVMDPKDDGREEPLHFDPVSVDVEAGVDVGVMPIPAEGPKTVRARRRMDIDQLDAAIHRVTGGIGWIEPNAVGTQENQFVLLAETLGKPDYLEVTREDLDPSAMFEKFLDDAARSVCTKLIARERAAAPVDRVFLIHAATTDTAATSPDQIEANLKELLLRYHGRSAEVLGAEIEQWKWLYRSAEHIAMDPVEAWRAVCVALITHPDFYMY